MFRLADKPDGLGLSFSESGIALAGVPLLYRTRAGVFRLRPDAELIVLLKAAYGEDPTRLRSSLRGIARAFNSRDFVRAAIGAVQTRTPELSADAAARLAKAAAWLAKFDPDEPRDWHGRWTSEGTTGQGDSKQTVANQSVLIRPVALAGSEKEHESEPQDSASTEQVFEEKYDDLGPVDFAKQVIEFGDRLGREGKNLSPGESADALAEYSFLQDRLSFWLGYDHKPPSAQNNLLSAALTLYEGAINAGVVQAGAALPRSMLYVGGAVGIFEGAPPRTAVGKPDVEEVLPPAYVPKEVDGSRTIVNIGDTGINWRAGIQEQGIAWEAYNAKMDPNTTRLVTNSKAFDLFNEDTREAISNKTLNTLSVSYIKNPYEIYKKMMRYINDAADYKPRAISDLDPDKILTKTVHLAIPEFTSPEQWRYIFWAIVDGKMSGVRVVITRIRE